MVKYIEKIISILKKDREYKINSDYNNIELFTVLYIRFMQICRGMYLKIWINSKGIVFCGRNVRIEHGYHLSTGKNIIIENNVFLSALSQNGIILGNNVTIGKQSIITCTGVISNKGVGICIGNNSAIGAQSFLGGQGGIKIGNDVIIGPQVKIFSENHNYNKLLVEIRKQGVNRKGVTIHDNCWIGAGSTILDGVELGSGCVIAAGSVVTKSFPSNSVIAGVPARILKYRHE
ncbi:MAG: acyltransferase [Hydrotalea sp. AMD]|uniref:acyltransferase n=1 Tax=Hydrotalea sp. AMD TaxID=2501297 RepID=UPI0009446FB9|nr:acyltransferase [Hydrotalea sp. AMD]RWZ88333.1 MAG: acyltransferase [Hydrotalea sp. AMD]